jgi:drug/metabolite transporter (DMT)-like permease
MSVSGAHVLHHVLSKPSMTTAESISACVSPKGLLGVGLMLLAFIVMTYTLSSYKAATFIPVNTAITFLVTLLASYLVGTDKMTISAVAGMVMISVGISLVLRAQ